MKKIKSDKIEALINLCIELFNKKSLKKVIFSKPDATDEIKSVASPKIINGTKTLQIETFSKDNKAYHLNIKENFEAECERLFYSHSQINIVSTLGDCQYMKSKGGKETVIGDKKIFSGLNSLEIKTLDYSSNNKDKK